LPEVWEQHPNEAMRGLEDLRQLTKGALAEMRTLLWEMRPEALLERELGSLLHQLADASASRSRVAVGVIIEGDRRFPEDVQVALYRIAQEALHNISKHAKATQASLQLR
jgi:signal transduction histidine kinase